MPATPSTLFVAFADPPADRDAEFNEWYDTIHGPDASANGSFAAMHRFRAVGDGHRAAPYLALWEGRFESEAEAWAYIGPRAQALREAGRAGDISSVRFALMTFRAANAAGSRCEPVQAHHDGPERLARRHRRARRAVVVGCHRASRRSTRPRGGWSPAIRPGGARATTSRCSRTTERRGRRPRGARQGGTPGMSPLPPYETIFGTHRRRRCRRRARRPAPAWVMRWEPITSLRA